MPALVAMVAMGAMAAILAMVAVRVRALTPATAAMAAIPATAAAKVRAPTLATVAKAAVAAMAVATLVRLCGGSLCLASEQRSAHACLHRPRLPARLPEWRSQLVSHGSVRGSADAARPCKHAHGASAAGRALLRLHSSEPRGRVVWQPEYQSQLLPASLSLMHAAVV